MSLQPDNDDDSFIMILGTSPGGSLDVKCDGVEDKSKKSNPLDVPILEDAIKDLPDQTNMAFKAQFQLGDSPSPASMMVASTLITDDRSTEELQRRFGELLDENVVLKETLKQNNDSMKEQFSLIASCQEDMLKTHKLHKEKFDETRELVEKLRLENKKLKEDIIQLSNRIGDTTVNGVKSGPSSTVEFVTSPDDDTINKLTSQLELVEKQRRQVIVENEKLSWQKESLEHIVDATSKERDDAKDKLKNLELLLSGKEQNYKEEIEKLQKSIHNLQKAKYAHLNTQNEQLQIRNETITKLEEKVSSLQDELKKAQIKILELENTKLEFSKYKSGVLETIRTYKEKINELNTRIKDIQTVVFQPVHMTMSVDGENSANFNGYVSNVKLYDRTLKHLAEYLNMLTNGVSDSLVKAVSILPTLNNVSEETLKRELQNLQQMLLKQHSAVLTNVSQVKGTLTIFEGIFKDYNELLKKTLTQPEPTPRNVEQLTAALVARGEEVQTLENEIAMLVGHKEDVEVLKAQLELYKSDFEAERKSRELMVNEKEALATDLRVLQRRYEELDRQMKEIRKSNPSIYKEATARARSKPFTTITTINPGNSTRSATNSQTTSNNGSGNANATGATSAAPNQTVLTCPKCMFTCHQYNVLDDHFEYCLDDF